MKLTLFFSSTTFIASLTLLISHVNAWSVTASTSVWPGAMVQVSFWGDNIPSLVNIQLAAQNADSTFTTVEQTDYNITPSSVRYLFRANSGTPIGMNYYIVAADVNNPVNFAVSNAIVVYEPFGDAHPTNSVTASGSLMYNTADGTATTLIRSSASSSLAKSTALATATSVSNSKTPSSNHDEQSTHTVFTPGVIAGIVIGCVAFISIVLFCVIKVIIPLLINSTKDVINYIEEAPNRYEQHYTKFSSPQPGSMGSNITKPETVHSNPFASGVQSVATSVNEMSHSNNDNPPNYSLPYPAQDMMPSPVHYNDPYPPVSYNNQMPVPVVAIYPESPKVESNGYAQKLEVTTNLFSQKEEYVHKPNDDTTITHDKPHS